MLKEIKKHKKLLLVLLVFFLIAISVIMLLLLQPNQIDIPLSNTGYFNVKEHGFIGDTAYFLIESKDSGELKLFSFNAAPSKEINVLTEKGIGTDKLNLFLDDLHKLKIYNYTVKVVGPDADIKTGIYIIPTGAMPTDVLDRIQKPEYSNLVIVYIGKKGLTYKGSVKNEDWYSKLTPDLKNRLIIIGETVDELLDKKNFTIKDYILKNEWALRSEKNIDLSSLSNVSTITFNLNNGSNIRLLYKNQLFDYPVIKKDKAKIDAATNIFQWEKSRVYFTIFQTNGTAHLVVEKDGVQIKDEKLTRVTSESIFLKFLEFSDPGDYLVKIKDNDEVQTTAIIHVKDLTVNLVEVRDGIYHVFNFAIDGEPIKQANVTVMLKDSENQKQFFITAGEITIPAKLAKGTNTFVFRIYGGEIEAEVVNKSEDIFGIYLTYGPIGLGLIIIIFIFARLNKKPVYTLRVGNVVQEIRKELRTTTKQAMDIFKTARKDLGIDGPLKAQEYGVGLKRHLTEGADVTEGNVEEILRKLEELNFVQSYKGYYQLKEEGAIKKNVLQRIIREKLIERGISFKFKAHRFITKEYEIGFFGDNLKKHGIFVFEDEKDIKDTLNGLSDRERSIFFLKEFNGIIELTTVDKLEEAL